MRTTVRFWIGTFCLLVVGGSPWNASARPDFTAEPDEGDYASDLVDRLAVRSIAQMESMRLTGSQLVRNPWSDDYWPLYKGGIAQRYADRKFPQSQDWKDNSAYLASPGNKCSVEDLSPAEKYDLLLGDDSRTLTRAMLAQGQEYYRRNGKVETWMGFCHGWAAAAIMMPRPARAIEVLSADGRTKIPFFSIGHQGACNSALGKRAVSITSRWQALRSRVFRNHRCGSKKSSGMFG